MAIYANDKVVSKPRCQTALSGLRILRRPGTGIHENGVSRKGDQPGDVGMTHRDYPDRNELIETKVSLPQYFPVAVNSA